MALQIRWSPRAAADLERICEHIARESETYAALVARRVVAAVETLADFPRSGRVVPEYDIESLREKLFQHYRTFTALGATRSRLPPWSNAARTLPNAL